LYFRERSGQGHYIDIAMQDTLLASMHKDFQTATLKETNDRHYGPLATADGFVIVTPLNQHHFTALARCIEMPELLDDVRFGTLSARIYNYDALQLVIESWTRDRASAAVLATFEAENLPCARYRDIPDLADDAQLRHRGMLTQVVDAAGPLTVPNTPFLFSETHASVGRAVAGIGQHNHAILSDYLHMSGADIAALEDTGVLGKPPQT
jgi:CoA:oxalate CoA-transferase